MLIAKADLISFNFYLGLMLGTSPLTRLLPNTSPDINGVFMVDDEGSELNIDPESLVSYSAPLALVSGIIDQMFSSSLTTSTILGLASGASLQHFRANVKKFSTYSEGYDPIRPSITENIPPAWYSKPT